MGAAFRVRNTAETEQSVSFCFPKIVSRESAGLDKTYVVRRGMVRRTFISTTTVVARRRNKKSTYDNKCCKHGNGSLQWIKVKHFPEMRLHK